MISKTLTIKNTIGLHARPAALFVQTANQFGSEIRIKKDNSEINGKSIMGIMAIGIASGETIEIITEGHDELEAMEALIDLVEHKLSGK